MKQNKKLWQKEWELNSFAENFETKDDILLDQKLTFFDVIGSMAQAKQLNKIGVLTEEELKIAMQGLKKINLLDQEGKFPLYMGEEDIHSKIENYLTKNYGEVGKKIHTGRSRNDQVLTALRLFTKSELLNIWQELALLTQEFLDFSKKYSSLEIPGYTHMQKAMPYTMGAWAEAFVAGLCDDLLFIEFSINQIDQSPLGSAAAFGTPLKIDRKYTSDLMGFDRVLKNTLYSQNSRGKTEALVLSSLVSILQGLNKFASDVLLFTTSEFNFLDVDASLCTGSSIMPQKKNIDIAELIRSKVHVVLGEYVKVVGLSSNLISGYNRDLQDSKKPIIESLETTLNTIMAAKLLIKGISPNKEKIEAALTPEIYAANVALKMSMDGTSFRDAYQKVGANIGDLVKENIEKTNIPSNYDYYEKCLIESKKNLSKKITIQNKAFEALLK